MLSAAALWKQCMPNPSRLIDRDVHEAVLFSDGVNSSLLLGPMSHLCLGNLRGPSPGCYRDGEHMVSVEGTISHISHCRPTVFGPVWQKIRYILG